MALIKDPEAPMQLRELCKECLAYDMDERACSDDVADWLQGVFEDLLEDGGDEAQLHEDDAPEEQKAGASTQDPAHSTGGRAHDHQSSSSDPPPAFEMSDAGDTDVEDSGDEASFEAGVVVPTSDDRNEKEEEEEDAEEDGDTESIGEPSGDAESDSDVAPPPPPPASDDGEQDDDEEEEEAAAAASEELIGDDEAVHTINVPSRHRQSPASPSARSSTAQARGTQPPPLPRIPATATSPRSSGGGGGELLPLGSESRRRPPSNPSPSPRPRPGSWRSVQSLSGGDRFVRLVNQKAAKSRAAIKRTVENVRAFRRAHAFFPAASIIVCLHMLPETHQQTAFRNEWA